MIEKFALWIQRSLGSDCVDLGRQWTGLYAKSISVRFPKGDGLKVKVRLKLPISPKSNVFFEEHKLQP